MEANVSAATKSVRGLPSDLEHVGVIAKYDILKYLRSRRLLGVLLVEAAVLAAITALVATSDQTFTADEVVGQYVGFANILIVLGATLFGGDAIVSEYQSRTGYLLFPNPVKKWSILAGKFASSTAAMALLLLIYYAVAILAGVVLGDGVSTKAFYSLGLALIYGLSALAVAFLISSVMKGVTGSMILTFALFFFIFSIITSLIGQLGGIKPWFMLDFAGSAMSYILQDPYPVDDIQTIDLGNGSTFTSYNFYPDVTLSVAVMGERIFAHILRVASGERTKSEELGLGDHEFVPWHLGIVS
jgi:ABC-type transport system involved in multi-copper enzyme maturation permease subunit